MKLHYTVHENGKKPWIIFLHGLLGSHRNWLKITPAFEKDFNILCVDQRGHGKSERPTQGFTPLDFAEDIHGLMHDLKIPHAAIVGHSMGGRNALMLAHNYPNHVSHLVLEDIGPESTYESGYAVVAKLKKIPVPFKNKILAKEFLLNEFGDPQMGNFLYTRLKEDQGGVVWDFPMSMVEEIINQGRSKNLWDEVRSLQCPTLVVRGQNSLDFSPDEYEKMLSINPQIQGAVIADCGHWVHFEKPKEFCNVVGEFLALPLL